MPFNILILSLIGHCPYIYATSPLHALHLTSYLHCSERSLLSCIIPPHTRPTPHIGRQGASFHGTIIYSRSASLPGPQHSYFLVLILNLPIIARTSCHGMKTFPDGIIPQGRHSSFHKGKFFVIPVIILSVISVILDDEVLQRLF